MLIETPSFSRLRSFFWKELFKNIPKEKHDAMYLKTGIPNGTTKLSTNYQRSKGKHKQQELNYEHKYSRD